MVEFNVTNSVEIVSGSLIEPVPSDSCSIDRPTSSPRTYRWLQNYYNNSMPQKFRNSTHTYDCGVIITAHVDVYILVAVETTEKCCDYWYDNVDRLHIRR